VTKTLFRVALAAVLMLVPATVRAQTNGQLWGDFTAVWKESPRQTVSLDFQPKVLVIIPPGDPEWVELGVTPSYMFTALGWLDIGSELYAGFTKQTNEQNSVEITPRIDVELHLFSRDKPGLLHLNELIPRRRVVVRDLVRVEFRNLFYSDGAPESSTVRFRNRLQLTAPFNKPSMTSDGAVYFLADWEWFIPLGEPAERFSDSQRVRAGLGHRRSYNWDVESLFVWNRTRKSPDTGYSTSNYAVDIRFKRTF
jgi:hypothetical protein